MFNCLTVEIDSDYLVILMSAFTIANTIKYISTVVEIHSFCLKEVRKNIFEKSRKQ